MIVRPQPAHFRAFASSIATSTPFLQTQIRCLHARIPIPRVPSPTPFVPDAQTFLTLIGRNLSQHASKIPSWEALFSLSSHQLKDLGVEPPRARRYLLRWREKFRNGQWGIGGEADKIVDGVAIVRVVELPTGKSSGGSATHTPGTAKIVVNTLPDQEPKGEELKALTRIEGLRVKGARTITGPHVIPVAGGKGRVAKIVIQEGLWEDRRGHKIDGGERRMAEVRAKKRAEERKNSR